MEAAKKAGVPIILAGTIDRQLPDAVSYYENVVKPLIDDEFVKYIGPINMQQKIKLFSCARGLLNPIQWAEPFGMVMIEAMAMGCPVISFARGAAPEIVVHSKTGFLADDIDEMIYYISKIDQIDRELTRKHVECNFSSLIMEEKYMKIYSNIITQTASKMRL